MTTQEIKTMIASVGIPSVYHHFSEASGQEPPFICYFYPQNDDFIADGKNYQRINELDIELYTDNKDFGLEASLESVLSDHGIVWDKVETYIDTEKMYMVTYTTEVLINV